VKGKNYRRLGGRPLFHHIIETLQRVPQIGEIVIDTDSAVITEDAAESFPEVRVIERPESLRGGDVPMNEVLLHDVSVVDADLYAQTHSTNPLLRAETISAAIDDFLSARDRYDSMFTVTPILSRLWTDKGEPINHDPAVLLRTQDLPPVYEENSCLYVFAADTLKRGRSRIGEIPLLYPLRPLEAWDIDDESDWAVVAALHAAQAGVQ
jgi:CMP-N-acetylneuraminic acid synthetase